MSTRDDPLVKRPEPPDRVFYATGALLDAQDFAAEQTYHRGRLARALAYVHGSGTVAGLRVVWRRAAPDRDERLEVRPGVAVDRLGRIIEVPRAACLRLGHWFDQQSDTHLVEGYRDEVRLTPDVVREVGGQEVVEGGTEEISLRGVVVDVFIRFVACERGKTPAFAAGPFDALDAVAPSRIRDGYEVKAVVRRQNLAQPAPAWPAPDPGADPAARRARLEDAIFGAWREDENTWRSDGLAPLPEHLRGQDTTSLFLARVVVPASRPADARRPERTPGADVRVDNHRRAFVYTAGALARWLLP